MAMHNLGATGHLWPQESVVIDPFEHFELLIITALSAELEPGVFIIDES